VKDSFNEEMGHVLHKFPKYEKNYLEVSMSK
jgi:hypothetical protein